MLSFSKKLYCYSQYCLRIIRRVSEKSLEMNFNENLVKFDKKVELNLKIFEIFPNSCTKGFVKRFK